MIKPTIITDHPVAYESHDHIVPKGTANDFTKNGAYVRELINRFGPDMKYMDLGCAGGGFIVQFHGYDVFAVGVEGSDYGRKHNQFGWASHPDYLFTADITKPFHFNDENAEQIKFTAISAFDVLEHIHEKDLPSLLSNIWNNLESGGVFIGSIATFEDHGYHVTLQQRPWWDKLFHDAGFVDDEPLTNYGRVSSFEVVYKKP
jgi:cyclopropane fatty-acyl-phospholipid synthase-like methyltransferase